MLEAILEFRGFVNRIELPPDLNHCTLEKCIESNVPSS